MSSGGYCSLPGSTWQGQRSFLQVPLSFVKHVCKALGASGLDVDRYSGHSFRIGAATVAAEAGVEDSMIKTLGCWKSSAYQTYIRIICETLASVAKKISKI